MIDNIHAGWHSDRRNVLAVMATGAGKSVVIGKIVREEPERTCVIAHREELVSQLSGHLAREGVEHRVVAPQNVIRRIVSEHSRDYGQSFVNTDAHVAVAGVDTLCSPKRREYLKHWAAQIGLCVIDEAAHVLRDNKWGKAVKLFHNARNLGVTATPIRADKKGIGAHGSGIYDYMALGPDTGKLIREGYLSDYEILLPESDLDLGEVRTTASGDFSPTGLETAIRQSHLVGDVVATYLKYAKGRRTVCFATSVKTAEDITRKYQEAGVRAEIVVGTTDSTTRVNRVNAFRSGEIDVLVSVDIFDEGFDLPAIEVVQMARPTQSLGKYLQQVGRGLRIMPGKDKALIIDHVSNVRRHGLPCQPRVWDLSDRTRSRNTDWIEPVRSCEECLMVYPSRSRECPYCGFQPVTEGAGRSIEEVDGDLALLSGEALEALRSAARLESPAEVARRAEYVAGPVAGRSAAKRQRERIESQKSLGDSIAIWAGYLRHEGRVNHEIDRLFYHRYGMAVPEALALTRSEMDKLAERIDEDVTWLSKKQRSIK